MEDLMEQIPFTLAHGPKFIERYERGEYDEEMMGFLETKLSEWDLMYRVRAAGCEDIEGYAAHLVKQGR